MTSGHHRWGVSGGFWTSWAKVGYKGENLGEVGKVVRIRGSKVKVGNRFLPTYVAPSTTLLYPFNVLCSRPRVAVGACRWMHSST